MREALWLSIRSALVAMLLVVPLGTLSAWAVSRRPKGFFRWTLESVLLLPLVLPPTVVGFGLLLLLGRGTAFGRWLNDGMGIQLLFTWPAAALAAAVMGFPLYVRAAISAFSSVDPELLDAARVLGATEYGILGRILIPISRSGLAAGLSLALARAIGEFGATLMVAGSVPGLTRTLPLDLYVAVQSGDDAHAVRTALLLVLVALFLLSGVGALERGRGK